MNKQTFPSQYPENLIWLIDSEKQKYDRSKGEIRGGALKKDSFSQFSRYLTGINNIRVWKRTVDKLISIPNPWHWQGSEDYERLFMYISRSISVRPSNPHIRLQRALDSKKTFSPKRLTVRAHLSGFSSAVSQLGFSTRTIIVFRRTKGHLRRSRVTAHALTDSKLLLD